MKNFSKDYKYDFFIQLVIILKDQKGKGSAIFIL